MKPELLDENFLDFEWINVPEVKNSEIQIEEKTKVLIVIKDTDLTPNAKILLSKILQAIGIDLATEAVLSLLSGTENINVAQIAHQKNPLFLLAMGLEASQLSLQVEYKQNIPFTMGKNKYLFTYDLSSLENNVEFKKALWAALKSL